MQDLNKKLNTNFELIMKLHERFVQVRDIGSTDEAEGQLAKEDYEYISKVMIPVYTAMDLYKEYDRSYMEFVKVKKTLESFSTREATLKKAKQAFKQSKETVKAEIKSIDDLNLSS